MTKGEKETLYNLLSVSQNFYRGYRDKDEIMPEFEDDSPTSNGLPDAAKQGMTIEMLEKKVAGCTRCRLCQTRKNIVFGQGVSHPLVLVIGEGPGQEEDKTGLPFVGNAGQLLDKMLTAINMSRHTNCYIANIVKCRPPANRDPLPEETDSCISYLESQIILLKPKMILCVGRIAAHKLFKCKESVNNMRGKLYDIHGIPAMMTYHPSALLRDESLKRPAWEDLKLFKRTLDQKMSEQVLNN